MNDGKVIYVLTYTGADGKNTQLIRAFELLSDAWSWVYDPMHNYNKLEIADQLKITPVSFDCEPANTDNEEGFTKANFEPINWEGNNKK